MSTKRFWIVLAAVLVLVALTAVTVIADPFGWASSEEGVEFEEWIGTVDAVIGDDPDEPGYTGEVVTSSGVPEASEGAIDLETLPAEPGSEGEFRPDEANIEVLESEPQWSEFYYDFSAGATMRPRASLTNWAYDSGGCIHPSKGADLFTLPLNLPDGVCAVGVEHAGLGIEEELAERFGIYITPDMYEQFGREDGRSVSVEPVCRDERGADCELSSDER